MIHWWHKVPLLVLATWGLGTTALHAQTQTIPVYEAPGQVQEVQGSVPVAGGVIVSGPMAQPGFEGAILSGPMAQPDLGGCPDCMQANPSGHYAFGRIKARLNRLGSACWAHHDEFGCDSFWSEARFVFGSCRAYFGFNCQPGPPYVPVPEGYALPPGHWR